MDIKSGAKRFQLPPELSAKISGLQRRIWSVKTLEAVFTAVICMAVTFVFIFVADRLGETPHWLRAVALLTGIIGWLVVVPWMVYRWVWKSRRLANVAKILAKETPRIGDRLLGVIELAQDSGDQHASPALCQAAIEQVATDTRDVDFLEFIPNPKHRSRGIAAAACCAVALAALIVKGAGPNALQRWAQPLADIPRYTFAQLDNIPSDVVVPTGESFSIEVPLSDDTVWKPSKGQARFGRQAPVVATLSESGRYAFEIPAQTVAGDLRLRIGDARHTISIEPKPRPELTGIVADVDLPGYLGRPATQKDVRGGSVSIVNGSLASFRARASRELDDAAVNGSKHGVTINGNVISSPQIAVDKSAEQEFTWVDVDGLSSKTPFRLKIRSLDDQAPTLQCENLPPEKVILDEDVLDFQVSSTDDFGVQSVGVEWRGVEDPRRNPDPDKGEYLLTDGGHDAESLNAKGVFAAKKLGIKPQPIDLRVYVEDYYPDRPRVYSPVCRLYVLNRDQHMIWVTEKLGDWERQALEVRDEEQRLFDTNKQLGALTPDELDKETNRRKISRQAAAERANARRLSDLSITGEQLINEALRNDEFNVQSLEKWAQMLKVLKKLSENDMPSVARLLGQAANAAAGKPSSPPTAPSVSDIEQGARTDASEENTQAKGGGDQTPSKSAPLGLPMTTLMGKSEGGQEGQNSAGSKMDQAVAEQEELLAEFNSVMGEMAKLLQELQGSTFVKRLKAAAREELTLASSLHDQLQDSFGDESDSLDDADQALLRRLYVAQSDTSTDVRMIQEDLSAYFERVQQKKFQTVRDEMRNTKVVSNFKRMSVATRENLSGETIAQAEFWADQLDRWAEIIVGPG